MHLLWWPRYVRPLWVGMLVGLFVVGVVLLGVWMRRLRTARHYWLSD